jgi:hypothetical protein
MIRFLPKQVVMASTVTDRRDAGDRQMSNTSPSLQGDPMKTAGHR